MNPESRTRPSKTSSANRRLYVWYGALLFVGLIVILRLFYLQVIRHDYYRQAALNDQLKQYSIPAERGVIQAHDSTGIVPIVLNQKLYTLYGDPTLVKKADETGAKVAGAVGGSAEEYANLLKTKKTRYVVLAKRLSAVQKDSITKLKLPGVGTQAQDYRTYPEGSLAAQLLGFVNNDGAGTYGIEQFLNSQLAGSPGMLKAITDAAGVPLAASRDNVQINPKAGDNVVLSMDVGMQKQLETILKNGLDRAKSSSGSALIMDPNTGAIKAMANLPTYDPSQYYNVHDGNVFNNAAVSSPLEVGSVMKTLTAAAALDQGVVGPDTSYYDPSHWLLDGSEVTNIEEDGGAGTQNIANILNLSINTGATWMLMQMGHETGKVNAQARDRWHDYMVNHYQLGKLTGIEQGYEAAGYIPPPDKGYGLQLTYANTSFGQAMTATPLQMAAALSAALNGGTYYQPHLVDRYTDSSGKTTIKKPVVVRQNVVSSKVSRQLQGLMEYVVAGHLQEGFSYLKFPAGYSVGGKTGTAQIANPTGGYYADKYNGTYMGFVGGDKPQYVIVVRVNQPGVGGYAGSQAAQPLFADLAHMLINDFNVTPRSGS
ncbi:MAG: putative Peptidoglycan glycosyltransferase [Candidatus Saccharibacteria bacterium]|nr:putative Peptidoglycan glycosyltransferase [Candidatus Saccharibacteria bacterium]